MHQMVGGTRVGPEGEGEWELWARKSPCGSCRKDWVRQVGRLLRIAPVGSGHRVSQLVWYLALG